MSDGLSLFGSLQDILASSKAVQAASLSSGGSSSTYWPVPGYKPLSGSVRSGHEALDIPAPIGTPVVSARGGIAKVERGEYGLTVRIQHPDTGLEEIYGHLSETLVKAGQWVNPDTLIGLVGNTGKWLMQPHLHFEVNPIGPEHFGGQLSDVNAIDPVAYLSGSISSPVPKVASSTAAATVAQPVTVNDSGSSGAGSGTSPATAPKGRGGASPAMIAADNTSTAQADKPSGGLPFGIGEGVVQRAATYAKRTAFGSAGFGLVLIGLLILTWSMKDEIAGAGGKLVGSAVAGAAGG